MVQFCIKINMKLVWIFFIFLLYKFLGFKAIQLSRPSAPMRGACLAQLAWDLIVLKSHTEERNKSFKPTLYLFLCKNRQLSFIQVVLVLIFNLPYYIWLNFKLVFGLYKTITMAKWQKRDSKKTRIRIFSRAFLG